MSHSCLRGALVFAAFYTLVQSLAYSIVTIYAISIFTCQAAFPFENGEPDTNTTSYLMYNSYFRGYCRLNHYQSKTAGRTYICMMLYSIVSSVWFPTAVLILVAAWKQIHGSNMKYFFLPWMVMTAGISIMDVVVTIIYSNDISHTLTIADYMKAVGLPQDVSIIGADGKTYLPAVIMTAFFSRGIVFWIINIFLFGFAVQGLRKFSNSRSTPAAEQEVVQMSSVERLKEEPRQAVREMDEPLRVEPSEVKVRAESRQGEAARQPGPFLRPEGPYIKQQEGPLPRRVYDVYGRPTEERLTPPAYRAENRIPPQPELSGYSKPWSYTHPMVGLGKE